jgi:methionyl-tRNA synthetase
MEVVLYTLAEVIRALAIAMLPVTPEAADKILDQLDIAQDQRYLAHIDAKDALKGGTVIQKPEGVFPRIVEQEEEQQKAAV